MRERLDRTLEGMGGIYELRGEIKIGDRYTLDVMRDCPTLKGTKYAKCHWSESLV